MDIFKGLSDVRSFLVQVLATKFHYLLLLGIISGIVLTYSIGRLDYAVRALIYIVPGILIIVILWIFYRKGEKGPDTLLLVKSPRILFQIFFVVLYLSLIHISEPTRRTP